MQKVRTYFPELNERQLLLLKHFAEQITHWNKKINLISRKDIQNIELHHIVHSLSLLKIYGFPKGSTVLDVGTGGGFPGVPLAIAFPQTHFTLIDARKKKIKVLETVVQKLALPNVSLIWGRVETLPRKYKFFVGRAVTNLEQLTHWLHPVAANQSLLFYYKKCEVEPSSLRIKAQYPLSQWLSESYFSERCILKILLNE